MKNPKITIGWLYPDFMNTYGDRGNILVLKSRCLERGILVEVIDISLGSQASEILRADFLFMGGAQDRQQEIVYKDLHLKKKFLQQAVEREIPGLYICGAYQLLGNYYITAEGVPIKGLEILGLYTENPGKKRLVGNIVVKTEIEELKDQLIIGFENHGGQTFLNKDMRPFGEIVRGHGNNEIDPNEGVYYKNTIGTYLHGPIFSKNPRLADWFIAKALKVKYGEDVQLKPMNDRFEFLARQQFLTQDHA